MKSTETSDRRPPEPDAAAIKMLPVQVGLDMVKRGLLSEQQLVAIELAAAEQLGFKVKP